jgi:hypothetical protein
MSSNAAWSSAADLALVFAVSADTLELYRQRGTVASRLDPAGRRVYDGAAVSAIFRRRGVPLAPVASASFGRLGEVTLGQPTAPTPFSAGSRPPRRPSL